MGTKEDKKEYWQAEKKMQTNMRLQQQNGEITCLVLTLASRKQEAKRLNNFPQFWLEAMGAIEY